VSDIFAPVCSITTTKRRRFFWAAWWTAPPAFTPFRKPDASDGGAATLEEALAAAEQRADRPLTVIDPIWARAWIRILRGEHPWPTRASREPRPASRPPASDHGGAGPADSIWATLGVGRDASLEELKAAYRRRVLEAHPDHGGDEASFRRVLDAYEEAVRRRRRPASRRRS
jgi:hypothetical protein